MIPKVPRHERIAIVLFAVFIACINVISFFISRATTPTGFVYLGTIHYWEDYFYYLNHFVQGVHGGWLTVAQYTSEVTPKTIIYWPNILLGKIGGILGLQPIYSYTLSVIILSCILIILFYCILRFVFSKGPLALYGTVIGVCATSIMNRIVQPEGPVIWWPFQIWRSPHFAFDRLGGAPNHLIQTICFFLLTFFCFYPTHPDAGQSSNKRFRYVLLFGALLSAMVLTSLNPTHTLIFLGCLWLTRVFFLFSRNSRSCPVDWLSLCSVSAVVLAFIVAVAQIYTIPLYRQATTWEALQQNISTVPFVLLSIGPIAFLAVIGFLARVRRLSEPEFFGAIMIAGTYGLFLSPIPKLMGITNLRVIFPATYVFFAAFAVSGTMVLSNLMTRWIHIKRQAGVTIILVLYLALSIPTLVWEIRQKLPKKETYTDMTYFLPKPISEGFQFLQRIKPYDDIVLASPLVHLDTLVPAFSGHTTYSGHMLMTLNNAEKQKSALEFFRKTLDASTASSFLASGNIRYVFTTSFDGSFTDFERAYPFLMQVFTNQSVRIYTVRY